MGIVWRRPVPLWRQGLPFLGFLAVAFAVLTGLMTMIGTSFGSLAKEYDAAPVCARTSDVGACRFEGPAQVVQTYADSEHYAAADLRFDELGGRVASATLDNAYIPMWQKWSAGDVLQAELWHGRVTRVEGVRTRENPETLGATGYRTAAVVFGALTLVTGGLFAWCFALWRRARAVERSRPAAVEAGSRRTLPLTPEMTVFLEGQARTGAHPALIFAAILGVAAIIPVIFSVVYYFEHRLLIWWTPVMWGVFLGLGGVFAWWFVHSLKQEAADLRNGVFERWDGPYAISVFQGRYSKSVRVVVHGRSLSGDASGLQDIESGTGTVDYLPLSGDLIEVRDADGHVLWSRFGAATAAPIAQSAAT